VTVWANLWSGGKLGAFCFKEGSTMAKKSNIKHTFDAKREFIGLRKQFIFVLKTLAELQKTLVALQG